jgi:hypothetical protein
MRPDPVDITLAGKTFTVRPLTLRQIRDIEVLSARQTESRVDQIAGILDIVLRREHAADLPEGGVLDMEVDRDELEAATRAIRSLSGMTAAKSGEAQPAPPAGQNSGEGSTAA